MVSNKLESRIDVEQNGGVDQWNSRQGSVVVKKFMDEPRKGRRFGALVPPSQALCGGFHWRGCCRLSPVPFHSRLDNR